MYHPHEIVLLTTLVLCFYLCNVRSEDVNQIDTPELVHSNSLDTTSNETEKRFHAALLHGLDINQDGLLSTTELDQFISVNNLHFTADEQFQISNCEVARNSGTYGGVLSCNKSLCYNASDIFKMHSINQSHVDLQEFTRTLPSILYRLQEACDKHVVESTKTEGAYSLKVWGIGFLCVTLINLCALLGMVFIPLMRKAFYKRLLMFMVALGAGTLTGSSLLFLIPECFEMTEEGSEHFTSYLWKSSTVIGGIYMFFLTERLLQSIMDKRHVSFHSHTASAADDDGVAAQNVGSIKMTSRTRHDSTSLNMSFQVPEVLREHNEQQQLEAGGELQQMPNTVSNDSHLSTRPLMTSASAELDDVDEKQPNGKQSRHPSGGAGGEAGAASLRTIKSVAWMVVFGDGVHNFIDGLSIGAAFTNSILAGVSVSIAVICEELPHELGDFAILLNSGMTMKQALVFNFLSACMCYLGLVFGILIGELTHGSPYIFALAGGMFLYISLVDMLPEVNHAAQEEVKVTGKMWPSFLIQNAGLVSGYGLMVFLASFTGQIDFEGLLS